MTLRRPPTVAELVDALRRPLVLASRDGFAQLAAIPNLGTALRAACDQLLAARAELPATRLGPLLAWRRTLERWEKLGRDAQEIEVARGLRLCVALASGDGKGGQGGPAPARPAPAALETPLGAPTTSLPGIGPKLAERLASRGLETVEDLAWFVPRRYDDLRHVKPLSALAADDLAVERTTVVGQVARTRYTRFRRRYLEVRLFDGGVELVVRWFNVPGGMAQSFPAGARVVVSGKLCRRSGAWEMANPDFLGDAEEQAAARAVLRPRYPEVEGVKPAILRRACVLAAQRAGPYLVDGVPEDIASRLGLPPLVEALLCLHHPPPDLPQPAVEALCRGESEWHRRLAFDELFFLALAVGRRRLERRAALATPCRPTEEARGRLAAAFSFRLTGAQERAIDAIAADLARPEPMNRLLQGDVGSGKTAVAFAAAHLVLAAGRQVALMAPTEILAEQHLATIEPWARALGHRVALLTASTPRGVRESTLGLLEAGSLGLVIGTHALLAERVAFADLGLVVIDEQHRFGVAQRVRLRQKNERQGGASPHLLVMTATPIPRTLALTVYGDLDVTTLDELPPGRTPPETKVLSGERGRKEAYERLRREVRSGARAFVVCPLVEPSESAVGTVWADVETTAAHLQRELFPARVGRVHGRMTAAEREAQMAALRAGEIEVLVATTVIEVGVDVPEARLMLVEDADRFGLAQLHQLRGRVGRGGGRSVCLLVTRGTRTSEGARRLAILEATADGFRIAEEDLAIRGPGEIVGVRQAGLPRMRFGDLGRHAALFAEARREAERVLADDPELARPEHAALAKVLGERIAAAQVVGAEGG